MSDEDINEIREAAQLLAVYMKGLQIGSKEGKEQQKHGRVVQVLWDGMYYGTTVECAPVKTRKTMFSKME